MTRHLPERIRAGDRRALARGITLVESTRADHRRQAAALVDAVLPRTGAARRVGVSGAPGAGKSTFIEALGTRLVDAGHRVAVLAVDPSSPQSGGSVLGDKTRMADLARRGEAFIRPSPAGATVGGVARRTGEALLLCEAAGFDVVIIETVGVGQSETAVDGLVDTFVLLVAPAGGDDLQGIKRGVVEVADMVVVTKADGDLAGAAHAAAGDYGHAVSLLRPKHREWRRPVILCSAVTGDGVDDVWRAVIAHGEALEVGGGLDQRRRHQAVAAMWSEVQDGLADRFRASPLVAARLPDVERRVRSGELSAAGGAAALLEASASA